MNYMYWVRLGNSSTDIESNDPESIAIAGAIIVASMWLIHVARCEFFIFCRRCLPSSVTLLPSFIAAVPMLNCWGQHSCMSFTFSETTQNGTWFFHSVTRIFNKLILLKNYRPYADSKCIHRVCIDVRCTSCLKLSKFNLPPHIETTNEHQN